MFSLTRQEILSISQIAISSSLKFAKNVNVFTEQGVAMLSGVLHSPRAVMVNIAIMRAFVRLKQTLAAHHELAEKFKQLESRVDEHASAIVQIVEEIRRIVEPVRTDAIGFNVR